MKIKILHILHSLQVGGLENGVVNLVNRLDPGMFDHAVCCIDSSGSMAERLTRPVEIFTMRKGKERDYLLPFHIARIVKKVHPDLVHTRNWGAIDGVIGARLAGVKRIIHGEHGREAADPTGANKRRKMARKALNPLISRFVTVSAELRGWLIDDVGISGDKIVQIINGVDTEKFRPGENRGLAKQILGLDPDSFVIGTVGRLDPVKDFQTLVKAVAGLFATEGDKTAKAALVVIGSGPEEQKLKTLADNLGLAGRVVFLGERKDVSELMQGMDLFVLPSIAEGISNTILEAMAVGLPVVASRAGGNRELVAEGENGFLFSIGDDRELASIIVDYINKPEMRLEHGSNSRSRTKTNFSLARMVREYEALYHSLGSIP